MIVAPGIGLHMQANAPDQTVRQIGIARRNKTDGQALFASSYYKVPQESALISGPYARPAALPFRNKSEELAEAARCAGETELGNYYRDRAAGLRNFEAYQAAAIPYVPPTEPPLELPEHVVPLPSVNVPRASIPITIDGDLSDAAWQTAAKVELNYTSTGEPAPVKTTALLAYDDKNLYIGFECTEPDMGKIKAAVAKRDGPTFYDDSVEAFIDPTSKRADYDHLSTNTSARASTRRSSTQPGTATEPPQPSSASAGHRDCDSIRGLVLRADSRNCLGAQSHTQQDRLGRDRIPHLGGHMAASTAPTGSELAILG